MAGSMLRHCWTASSVSPARTTFSYLSAWSFSSLFSNRGVFARIRYGIEKALTDNWQLTLLASTGIALSLASGYTTFDGLRNFTNAHRCCRLLISFGIQGVMLIVAWLIGESFATGMNQRTAEASACAWSTPASAWCSAWRFVGIAFYWVLNQSVPSA